MLWGKDKLKEEGGFTLVEILIAIFIVSILIVSASMAFIYSTKTSGDNELRLYALNLANRKVESIRGMDFAEIGTKAFVSGGTYYYGDPAGEILQEEIIEHNGLDYLVKVNISWEEEAEWDLSGSAEWDYKSVWVSVTPIGDSGFHRLEQTIQTYVTRDYSQPALKGSNIRIRCVRGWMLPGVSTSVIQGVNAKLNSGPSAVRFVNTSAKGVASFIDLDAGDYEIEINSNSQGYIIHPNASEIFNMTLVELETVSLELELEKPCSIRFILKDLSGNPITSSYLGEGASGRISIVAPYPTDSILQADYTSSNIDDLGRLPEDMFNGLWPVGDGYAGAYAISNVSLDNLQFIGGYTNLSGVENQWNGKFNNPGTLTEVILYFSVAPVTPTGVTTDWVDETNSIRTGSYNAVDTDNDPLEAGILRTDNPEDTIIMSNSNSAHFNGYKLFVENSGSSIAPGLHLERNSTLNLHGSEIVFRGKVLADEAVLPSTEGRIHLTTTWEDGTETSTIYGSAIDDEKAEDSTLYGKLYLIEPLYIGENLVIDSGGYFFPNGTTLPDQSSRLIPFTKENYVE